MNNLIAVLRLCVMTSLILPLTATSQVDVTFANIGPGWSRPIFAADGLTPLAASPDLHVELTYDGRPFGGTEVFDTAAGSMTPIIAPGLFAGGIRSVAINRAFAGAPSELDAIIRVWDSSTGATDFNSATYKGQSLPFKITLPAIPSPGSPPAFPATLINMQSFAMVPEPSSIGVASIGALALLFLLQRRA